MAPHVAIACGGTGGHFFPGVAVARELQQSGARVTLVISEKPVDQQAVATVPDIPHWRVPAVGFSARHPIRFLLGLRAAMKTVRRHFESDPPQAVLAMGGFTSAAPIWCGRRRGAVTFLHESNAIPGRANRLLARSADEIFVGFEAATKHFRGRALVTGTPVREAFRKPSLSDKPLLLITGGSQGAHVINRLATEVKLTEAPIVHICGADDFDAVKAACAKHSPQAEVHAFVEEMPSTLARASVVISRAGASFLAELAAARVPAILIPLPNAADDHQRANARVAGQGGGAIVLEQSETTPEGLAKVVRELMNDESRLKKMSEAMGALDAPEAARCIAGRILARLG
ncbi:MAG TPA: UDP-N-acetylglucosamine--N-acetylmuramyl-(pentapeptide) pyrophosphoryl-undecaprenol N-acetylglucosamine transferase [Verrucomicrobiales bacterium]|jgi:UDP-N-acetylglucosamine--N-acetylmuramyl-(pentapeptide) pyrophosphoryl-undecaprenol N-acetylglucosamine transferase|nr:UDP-N-acetylglucosamine--N-acetylmuramyl-(pentapeptide) pyrophosphoryl-undecaprenol N-acetylglucosamine transferase [Verrucomicrobiales bacterium]HIL24303.1 UDP-N-acetylglucosamine--N-acetylmuramyl-(pentapeptide) pyrophosphoryl-undecaprenol N-acetylglucosamine transferase [Verrucomicrobiota bacterium]